MNDKFEDIEGMEIVVRDKRSALTTAPTADEYPKWIQGRLAGSAPALYDKLENALIAQLSKEDPPKWAAELTAEVLGLRKAEESTNILINSNNGNTVNQGFSIEDIMRQSAERNRREADKSGVINVEIIDEPRDKPAT